eukprot:gene22861-27631_t
MEATPPGGNAEGRGDGADYRNQEARRQAQLTAKIAAEQVEAVERRSREQLQMFLAEQAATDADQEKASSDRLRDALSAIVTAHNDSQDALALARAETAQLRGELERLIARRTKLEQQLAEPRVHSLTYAAGRSVIDLTPRNAAPVCDPDEATSAAPVHGSIRSMRKDPASRAIVRRRDSVDTQVIHLSAPATRCCTDTPTDRPAMRWDSSPTKYAPPQRRNGKAPANPPTDGVGGNKDGDEGGSAGGSDHADDQPGP